MICHNCHSVFDSKDVVSRFEDYGERVSCCPVCGASDLEETESCDLCGKELSVDELCEGFCIDCLWNAIDYDVALAYMKDRGELAVFFTECIWNTGRLEHSSVDFDLFLEETFKRMVAGEKLSKCFVNFPGKKDEFLEQCRYFCLPYYYNGDFGPDGCYFAEWYKDHRKEAK